MTKLLKLIQLRRAENESIKQLQKLTDEQLYDIGIERRNISFVVRGKSY